MLDIIRKQQYWDALDNKQVFQRLGGFTLKALDGLKHIQDACTLHRLLGVRNSKVLEVGGGLSRVLPALDPSNERWNLDEFAGEGNGVTVVPEMPQVRLVRRKLGDFAAELSDAYFDIAFSISVVEHIADDQLDAFWRDHARVLKPGGLALHMIDLYLSEAMNPRVESRVNQYSRLAAKHGLCSEEPAVLLRPLVFRCDMASNSDWGMWRWNKNVPALEDVRRRSQSVSLAMVLRRSA